MHPKHRILLGDIRLWAQKCEYSILAQFMFDRDHLHAKLKHPNVLETLGVHNAHVRPNGPLTFTPCNHGLNRADLGTATTRAPSVLKRV